MLTHILFKFLSRRLLRIESKRKRKAEDNDKFPLKRLSREHQTTLRSVRKIKELNQGSAFKRIYFKYLQRIRRRIIISEFVVEFKINMHRD